jgi:hypothetical protein
MSYEVVGLVPTVVPQRSNNQAFGIGETESLGGFNVSYGDDDNLILGKLQLSSDVCLPSQLSHGATTVDQLHELMLTPRDAIASGLQQKKPTLKPCSIMSSERPIIMCSYDRQQRESLLSVDERHVRAFAHTNIVNMSAPSPFRSLIEDSLVDELLAHPSPQDASGIYWDEVLKFPDLPNYVNDIIQCRKKFDSDFTLLGGQDFLNTSTGNSLKNVVYIRYVDDINYCIHFEIDEKIIADYHYALIREPILLEVILNSPNFRRALVTDHPDGNLRAEFHESVSAMKFKVRENNFNMLYQPRKAEDITIATPAPKHCVKCSGSGFELYNGVLVPWIYDCGA